MVKVSIEKLIDGTTVEHKIRRRRIAIPSISYVGYVAEGIGYIRHSDFTDKCYEDMRAAILRLQSEGELKSLILDYRNNGGGLLHSAIKILSLFVPKGTMVVETRGRGMATRKLYTEYEPLLPTTPLAVLINGNSASAAEIVAGAIQDLDRGVLLGQRSFGKGLVQSTTPLGYNAFAKITVGQYYIPSGRCIQAVNYSKDGRAEVVADSLIGEFKTSRGRKVYDGGGIMPDKVVPTKYISNFAATLYLMGIIEDFGDEYIKKYGSAWGCDLCQEHCPYTNRAQQNGTIYTDIDFFKEDTISVLRLKDIETMSDEEFGKRAYSWRGRNVISRNLNILEEK